VSLVADRGGEIVGHVLLSRMRATGDGRACRAVGLGPVAVVPGFQGGGIGAGLIEAALGIARATGEEIVFLLGEPDYYRRFGFSADAAAPFASPYAGPYFMALVLQPGFRLPVAGEAAYAPAFSELPEA
jgi:putative acetyltransferase